MEEKTPEELEKLAQQVRILLMVYRQGWIDASVYLTMEANDRARKIKKQYDSLVREYPINQDD